MASTTTVFSSGSHTVISQPILKCKPITSTIAPQLTRKKEITHYEVNIQDGDFTFIHPSV
jgi:hypothetical protein